MPVRSTFRRNLIFGGVAFGLVATPSFALFGIGDVVFDPTSYAQLLSQATTAYSHYKAFVANVEHFKVKTGWQTALSGMQLFNAANRFGETAGLTEALNTSKIEKAIQAWVNTSVKLEDAATPYLSAQHAGGSQRAMLAMIEASDAVSPNCLNAIGSYRQARTDNAAAQAKLQEDQLDGSDETNSEVQQLNLLNASQAQHMAEIQSQGVIHACIASQMTISNMQQRNAAVDDLNTKSFIQQQHETSSAYATNGSDTWTTYLP